MSERFDDLSRRMAQPLPRRGALKAIGGALFGSAALVALRPLRGDAKICAGTICGSNCCSNGQVCLDVSTSKCGCAAGTKTCGPQLCCEAGGACTTLPNGTGNCCCKAGETACGIVCCPAGVACANKTRGICGCPAGTTTCRYGTTITCCDAGVSCPPTVTCPQIVSVVAQCVIATSDVNVKSHVVAVAWD
jgi:hypothetical protein